MDHTSKNKGKTITALIEDVFTQTKIPISTLKLNAKILKDLGLIKFFNGDPVRLTDFGQFVFSLIAQNSIAGSTASCNPVGPRSIRGSGIMEEVI